MNGGVTTENHRDVCGSVELDQVRVINRVEKKAIVTYSHTLNSNQKWTQFPDLNIKFNLPFRQMVKIKYNIQTYQSTGEGYFVTRIMINGKENIEFRQSTGHHRHHSNSYDD